MFVRSKSRRSAPKRMLIESLHAQLKKSQVASPQR
jgi:hypothetical protein